MAFHNTQTPLFWGVCLYRQARAIVVHVRLLSGFTRGKNLQPLQEIHFPAEGDERAESTTYIAPSS